MTRRTMILAGAAEAVRNRGLQRFNPSKLPGTAVVLIHGAGGRTSTVFPCTRYAQQLARAGYVSFLPDYRSAPTEAPVADICAAIDKAYDQPGVLRNGVGLLGFSQGGGIALAVASQRRDVRAVVVWSGNLPDAYYQRVRALPPTLLLHSVDDRVIPLGDARKVIKLCELRRLPCQLEELDSGHGFRGRLEARALSLTIGFLARASSNKGSADSRMNLQRWYVC